MANAVSVLVYQVNQRTPLNLTTEVAAIGFPTNLGGYLLRDTILSPARSLSTGVNVYSAIQAPDGTLYYCRETLAQLITLFG